MLSRIDVLSLWPPRMPINHDVLPIRCMCDWKVEALRELMLIKSARAAPLPRNRIPMVWFLDRASGAKIGLR